MVRERKGRIFRRTDGKYLMYLPLSLAEDSMFPFREELEKSKEEDGTASIKVNISFEIGGDKLIVSRAGFEPAT